MTHELWLPPEKINKPNRDAKTGRFLKGHNMVPHNKGKHPREYLTRHYYRKIKKNLEIGQKMKKPGISKALSKPVVAIKNNSIAGIFRSSIHAQEKTSIKASNIRAVCNGKRKHAGGYKWFFEADDAWIDLIFKENDDEKDV